MFGTVTAGLNEARLLLGYTFRESGLARCWKTGFRPASPRLKISRTHVVKLLPIGFGVFFSSHSFPSGPLQLVRMFSH